MSGDGPLNGVAAPLKTVLLGDDPAAADARVARLMGLDPIQIVHIRNAGRFLGNVAGERIVSLT
jgi:uncharacterized protein (DUF362 family)